MKKQPEEKVTEMPKPANVFKDLPHDCWTLRKGMKAKQEFQAAGHNCRVRRIVDASKPDFDLCEVEVIKPTHPERFEIFLSVGGVIWGQA